MPASRFVFVVLAVAVVLAWGLPPGPSTTGSVEAGHDGQTPVLSVEYVRAQYEKGRKLTAIDLRSLDEYRQGHLPGALSLPLNELTTRFHEVPRTDLVVLYCECTPGEVEVAYTFLRRQQYRNLTVLGSSFKTWIERGFPIER